MMYVIKIFDNLCFTAYYLYLCNKEKHPSPGSRNRWDPGVDVLQMGVSRVLKWEST